MDGRDAEKGAEGGGFEGVAVKRFVAVQERLHVVFAGRQVAQAAYRIAGLVAPKHLGLSSGPAVYIQAEYLRAGVFLADLKAGFGSIIFGK